MAIFTPLAGLTPVRRRAFIAAFLGWTLDAFDFFLVTFVVSRVGQDFAMTISDLALLAQRRSEKLKGMSEPIADFD